jgi:type 1 fimbria pilin
MKRVGVLVLTGLIVSSVACYAGAPGCDGHGKPAKWQIQNGQAITLDVTIQVGSDAATVLKAGKEENLKDANAETPLVFHVEASDQDNHVCQGAATPVGNYIQKTTITVTIKDKNGAELKTLTLDTTPATGNATVRSWDKTWSIPASATGDKLSISFQGTVDDVACTAHTGSNDDAKAMSVYSAKLKVK